MKNVVLRTLFGIWVFISCSSPLSVEPVDVHSAGTLRQMMHQGDISPQADLNELENHEHLYALGALAELKGEVLVWDGMPLMARAVEGQVEVQTSFDHEASLLVYAQVRSWERVEIPDSVRTYSELELFVEASAANLGIDTEKPFPFLVEGDLAQADWHVIDWPEGDTVHSHQKHVTSGPHGEKEDVELQVLGFYSKHHHTIFTHHSTNMHLHGKSIAYDWAAHIDDLTIGSKAVLKLPVR